MMFRRSTLIVCLALVAPALASATVVELSPYQLYPAAVVPDGEGGVLLFAKSYDEPLLARLGEDGKLIWAKSLKDRQVAALVPFRDGAALVSYDTRADDGEGFQISTVDINGDEGPRRHYSSEQAVGVLTVGGGRDRIVVAVQSGQSQSVVLLDEDLTAVRQFGFRGIRGRRVEGVTMMPDGGAVFVGIDRDACFVGRMDATGRSSWLNRYRLADKSGCTHVGVTASTIFVGGWTKEEIVLLALEFDGDVRYASKIAGRQTAAALATSEDGVTIVTQHANESIPTLISRFDENARTPRSQVGLVRTFRSYPWGVAAAFDGSGELVFAAVDEVRSLFVASQAAELTSQCRRFVNSEAQWTPFKVRPEPLSFGTSGFEIVHRTLAPVSNRDLPVKVRACRGP